MSNTATQEAGGPTRTEAFEKRLKQRYRAERRFRALGLGAILFSIAVLIFLLGNMLSNGIGGFQRAELEVPIDFTQTGITTDEGTLTGPDALRMLEMQGLSQVVRAALA